MLAVKNWFLEKNQIRGMKGKELKVIKETQKAILVEWKIEHLVNQNWIPKSCIIEEWEKDTSNFAYHEYLVETLTKAYKDGRIENHTFKSGRNVYDATSFLHKDTTKGLIKALEMHGIEYMNRTEWDNR